MDVNIGVLAIQGSFLEHECALLKCLKENGGVLEGLNLHIHRVTQASDVSCLDGLVIPGGESSVISQILSDELLEELNSWLNDEKHVLFGTCAGLIVLSKGLENAIEGQITRLSKVKGCSLGCQLQTLVEWACFTINYFSIFAVGQAWYNVK